MGQYRHRAKRAFMSAEQLARDTIAPAVLPRSYMSRAESEEFKGASFNYRCNLEAAAAREAGDTETYWQWLALIEGAAPALLFLKRTRGADFLRKYAFNQRRAIAEYGAGWLDDPRY
jgi:hypothetical protein